MAVRKCGPAQFTRWQPAAVSLVIVNYDGDPAGGPWESHVGTVASGAAHGVCQSQCGRQRPSQGAQLGAMTHL